MTTRQPPHNTLYVRTVVQLQHLAATLTGCSETPTSKESETTCMYVPKALHGVSTCVVSHDVITSCDVSVARFLSLCDLLHPVVRQSARIVLCDKMRSYSDYEIPLF